MSGSGDFISRADAIEALYKDAEAHQDPTFWATQHEALLNIHAADVVPLDYHERCLQIEVENRLALELQMPRWIPVTERLPEEYVNVLCHLRSLDRRSEYYSIDHLMEDGQWWKSANSWKFEVTHWQPLPEPPKEEGETWSDR